MSNSNPAEFLESSLAAVPREEGILPRPGAPATLIVASREETLALEYEAYSLRRLARRMLGLLYGQDEDLAVAQAA